MNCILYSFVRADGLSNKPFVFVFVNVWQLIPMKNVEQIHFKYFVILQETFLGVCAGIIVNLWLTIGSFMVKSHTSGLPVSVDGCRNNNTITLFKHNYSAEPFTWLSLNTSDSVTTGDFFFTNEDDV